MPSSILYELLTGRPPFRGANAVDTLLQVRLLGRSRRASGGRKRRADLERSALKCLEKEPRLRYPSARELAEDLHRFQDRVPIKTRQALLTERAWKATRRHPSAAAMGVAAGVVFVIMFAGMAWRRGQAENARAATSAALASATSGRSHRDRTCN